MRAAEFWTFLLVACLAVPASAARLLPESMPASVHPAASGLSSQSSPDGPRYTRSQRLLGESLAAVGMGLVAPFSAWAAATSSRSFQGFFMGVGTASLLGWVGAPLAVLLTARALGEEGKAVWRGVLGAGLGLLVGLAVGGVLATAPSTAYLAGLGILWAAPAAGALVGLASGNAPPTPPTATVTLRF